MDTTQTITHVSLCAGYGGIDLGLKRAVRCLRTIAFSEIEAYACANLVQKMEAGLLDAAPIWTNLKTFPYRRFRGVVDILSGGYPCQPFSAAGKRLGKDDPRHLWPWIRDGIDNMRPGLCFFENVEGHVSLGLRDVLCDLEELGYEATWGIFSAAEVGAPHQRKRVFIMAHRNDAGSQGWHGRLLPECAGELPAWPSRPSELQYDWEPARVVADGQCLRELQPQGVLEHERGWVDYGGESLAYAERAERWPEALAGGNGVRPQDPDRNGECGGRQTEPPMGRVPYGRSYRVDELRLLGNGVVPATAERAFRTLYKRLIS